MVEKARGQFREFLHGRGLRFTRERQAVLDEVLAQGGHFQIQHLCQRMARHEPRVSKATVYRTVALLVQCGLVREVIAGERRTNYETIYARRHHDHLICLRCGKIIEFVNNQIESLQDEVCQHYGFQAKGHSLEIRGLCKACQIELAREAEEWERTSSRTRRIHGSSGSRS